MAREATIRGWPRPFRASLRRLFHFAGRHWRALWSCFLLFVTMWSVLPSPCVECWFLSVGVPELGIWFAMAILPVFCTRKLRWELVPALLVLVLGLSPWVRAVMIARELPSRLTVAFGYAAPGSPLSSWERPFLEPRKERVGSIELDHYCPPSPSTERPVVLFIHGGSWSGGSRSEYPGIFQILAQRGWDVYSMDYRLAPAHPYPAQLEDIRSVTSFLRSSGKRVVLMGRSAGAHLALLAAYTEGDQGVVALYPPVDMVWSWDHPSNPAVLDSRKSLRDFLGGSPTDKPVVYAEASPLRRVLPGACPTLLIHGLHDQLVYPYQSEMLQARLSELQVPHLLIELGWADHGGDVINGGPTSRLTLYAIESFLYGLHNR